MNDVSKNIRAFVFTTLDGNITFESNNVPCWNKAPPNQSFPYIIIKNGGVAPDHSKDKTGGIYEITIEVNTRFSLNEGGQDDADDISNSILNLLGPIGQHTSNFGSDTMIYLTGPNIRYLEDDDDEFHYYTKILTYEAKIHEN